MAQILSNLPVGAKIKFGKHKIGSETALPIIWVVADKNHSGYPSQSVTLVTEKIIDVLPYDEEESGTRGNTDYSLSNINQWLNSFAEAGKWYSPTHTADVAPPYQSRAGFLYNFTANERNTILPTTLTVQNGSDVSKSMTASIFLLSVRELRGTSAVDDGSTRLEYFESNGITAVVTQQVFSYSAYKPESISTKYKYFTRNTDSKYVVCVSAASGTENFVADDYMGIRPAVNLTANYKVSDTTDADGCYTLIVNNVPTISGSNTNLGSKTAGFNHTYTVGDADSEAVTVKEYIDNVQVRSYVATLGNTNTFAVTGTTWLKLTNGTHTLKITATDGFATTTRTITFTKSVNKIVIQRTTPIAASTQPNQIIVTLVKNIPYNALLTVEVCNNGFDANPTWETLEASSISSGLAHTFSNKTNTAGKWGVNIRVTVDRNGGEGACYISEIGGNFE